METKARPTRGVSILATMCSHWFSSGLYISAELITSWSACPPATKISCPSKAAAAFGKSNLCLSHCLKKGGPLIKVVTELMLQGNQGMGEGVSIIFKLKHGL